MRLKYSSTSIITSSMLLESYYNLFSKETKEAIDKLPKVKKILENDKIVPAIINDIIDSTNDKDYKALLQILSSTNDYKIEKAIYLKLLKSGNETFGGTKIPNALDEDALNVLANILTSNNYNTIIKGKVPILEYLKRLVDTNINYKPSSSFIIAIYEFFKEDILDGEDLIKANWILNPNIYKEGTLDSILYKIKLFKFLKDEDELKKFKDSEDNHIPDEYKDWDDLIQVYNFKDIKKIFSKYDDSSYQKESKNFITLEDWIEKQVEKTKNEKDNAKKWVGAKPELFKKFILIVDKNKNLNEKSKEFLKKNLQKIFSNKFKSQYEDGFLKIKLLKNTSVMDDDFIKTLIKYFEQKESALNAESNLLIPGDTIKVQEALKVMFPEGITAFQLYGKLKKFVPKLDRKIGNNTYKYLQLYNYIFKNENILKDFMNAPIDIDNNGELQWSSLLQDYIGNIYIDLKNI